MSTPVIECSLGSYRGFDPVSRRTTEGSTMEEVYNALGRPKTVGLALSRRVALLKQITLPDVPREQMASIVRLQMDQLFPVSMGELTSDFQVLSKNGTGVKALVVAVRTDTLRQAIDDLRGKGVTILWIAPTAMAAPAVVSGAGLNEGVVIEQLSDGVGFDVVQKGVLSYSRSSVTPDSIESLEHELSRTVSTVRAEDATVIAVGGLRTDLASVRVQSGSLEVLAGSPPKLDLSLPEDKARVINKKVASKRFMALGLWAGALLVATVVFLDRSDDMASYTQQKLKIEAPNRQYQNLNDGLSKQLAVLDPPAIVLSRAFEPAQSVSDVLTVLNDKASTDVWLTMVNFERGKVMTVRGSATTQQAVADYVTALTSTGRLTDISLQFANDAKIDDSPVINFAFTAHVLGNLPIMEKTKK